MHIHLHEKARQWINLQCNLSEQTWRAKECLTALSQGHDQTVPNGAKNGHLHTLSGHNTDTNPSVVRACVLLTQLFIVS